MGNIHGDLKQEPAFRYRAKASGQLILLAFAAIALGWALADMRSPDWRASELALAISAIVILVGVIVWHGRRLQNAAAELALRGAVQVAEIRFSSTFEQAAVGMAHGSFDGRILRINQRFCDMLGYSRDEILRIPLFELTHPDDRAFGKTQIKRIMAGEILRYSDERRYLAKDGRTIPAAVTVAMARGVDGEPDYLVAVMQDISTRKSVEDNLRVNEERFRLAMQGANDGLWDWRLDTGETYFSPRWKSMLGYGEDEIGDNIEQAMRLMDPASLEAATALIGEIRAGAHSKYQIEIKMRHKNGHWLDILSRGFPVFDERGEMVRFVGTHIDITERKRHEAQLALSAAVFKSAQEGIIVTDLNGEIVMVNPALKTMTGYDDSELIGQRIGALRSGRHEQSFYRKIWKDIRTSGYWQGEIWNCRKSGENVPDWLTISTVFDSRGLPTNYVTMFTDISQLKQTETRLSHLAHHDPLTDLPNRLLLRTRIDHALARADRNQTRGAVLFLDLDRFKMVNDSLGHVAGDQLLQLVVQRLKSRLRASDTLARLGGDEFVVVIEDLDDPLAVGAIAQDLIDEMVLPFLLAGEREVYVGLSIGVSLLPLDGDSADRLIQHADTALYLAKEAGGSGFRFYSKELTSAAARRLKLEADMRHALARGEFVLQFQPLMSLTENRMAGVEALVRWRSPDGLIPPLSFIPVAEENGLIVALGEWVLRESCERMKAWRAAGLELDTIAVNLSPVQFERADLCEKVSAILAETGLDPAFLELEITESALMEQGGGAEAKLAVLKALGLRIAIDDFGTGHSSLAYLKRFPIDKLKIDRAFIADIPGDTTSMEITAAIIRLAHSLKLKTLAEGIETKAQAEFLAVHGCDMAQGYYFDEPLWEEELIDRLAGLQRDRWAQRKKA